MLSSEKRQCIAELARRYGFWIMEDAPYRRLRYRGEDLPTLFHLVPDRVILMSSYSKLISPGLRVGYVIGSEPWANGLAKMAEDTYINASYLNQTIVAEFIQHRWLGAQIARLKELYAPKLDTMLEALEDHTADLATWRMPEGWVLCWANA